MKGYCSAGDVAIYLGIDLTAAQLTQATDLIGAAESELDGAMNRGFLMGAISNELHRSCPRIYVQNPPVATLASVEGRVIDEPAEPWEVLVVADDYELVNVTTGEIHIAEWRSYAILRVTYTTSDSVPADIRQATVELVASRIQPTLNPALYGVDSVTLPDYSVRYNRALMGGVGFPPTVLATVERYRIWPGSG